MVWSHNPFLIIRLPLVFNLRALLLPRLALRMKSFVCFTKLRVVYDDVRGLLIQFQAAEVLLLAANTQGRVR
jgi:hypothetical protein